MFWLSKSERSQWALIDQFQQWLLQLCGGFPAVMPTKVSGAQWYITVLLTRAKDNWYKTTSVSDKPPLILPKKHPNKNTNNIQYDPFTKALMHSTKYKHPPYILDLSSHQTRHLTWHLLLLSILERDPPLLLSWRFLQFIPQWRVVWEFFLIRCESLEQIVKHSEANL